MRAMDHDADGANDGGGRPSNNVASSGAHGSSSSSDSRKVLTVDCDDRVGAGKATD